MELIVYLGAGAAALLAIGAVLRWLWRVNLRIVRIADLVTELSPNSGHSIKDTVDRTERKVDRTEQKVDRQARQFAALNRRFDDHLNNHP